jgi:hypothetical protein
MSFMYPEGEGGRASRTSRVLSQRWANGSKQAILKGPAALQVGREQMTVSAVSHYRGGTIDVVTPLAKTMKAVHLKHGVAYRLSRFETGPNAGDWLLVVQYADMAAYEAAPARFAQDPEWQQAVAEISKVANRISRELVVDLDL